jgi:hypothetical protein
MENPRLRDPLNRKICKIEKTRTASLGSILMEWRCLEDKPWNLFDIYNFQIWKKKKMRFKNKEREREREERRRTKSQLQLVLIIEHDSFNVFHLKHGLLFSLLSNFFPDCFYEYIFPAKIASSASMVVTTLLTTHINRVNSRDSYTRNNNTRLIKLYQHIQKWLKISKFN